MSRQAQAKEGAGSRRRVVSQCVYAGQLRGAFCALIFSFLNQGPSLAGESAPRDRLSSL